MNAGIVPAAWALVCEHGRHCMASCCYDSRIVHDRPWARRILRWASAGQERAFSSHAVFLYRRSSRIPVDGLGLQLVLQRLPLRLNWRGEGSTGGRQHHPGNAFRVVRNDLCHHHPGGDGGSLRGTHQVHSGDHDERTVGSAGVRSGASPGMGRGRGVHELGAMDFAGGLVVHTTAGVAALVIVSQLGGRDGFPYQLQAPHNLGLVATGVGTLWVGWFGFNGGSFLVADGRPAMALASTHFAACSASIIWSALDWVRFRKPSLFGTVTG